MNNSDVAMVIVIGLIIFLIVGWLVNRICTCIEKCSIMRAFGRYMKDQSVQEAGENLDEISKEIFGNMKK